MEYLAPGAEGFRVADARYTDTDGTAGGPQR